jgi:2'-5' RNA ligase
MSDANMYFLAIAAPADINKQVLEWKHYMRDHFGCTVALRSPAHITLIPPFWMNKNSEDDLNEDAAAFARQQHSFEISLLNFEAFKPKVIFVQVEENAMLKELKLSLEDFLLAKNKYPFKKESRPFHPHVTIANRDLRKKDFTSAFEHFSKISYRESFAVHELALLKHDGTQWNVHRKFPMGTIS